MTCREPGGCPFPDQCTDCDCRSFREDETAAIVDGWGIPREHARRGSHDAPGTTGGYLMRFDAPEVLESGAIRSDASGKGRYDLLPPRALRRVAVVYEKGADQKGDRNWERGMPRSRLFSSALRHTFQALDGEADEDHLAHAVWNLLALMHFEEMEEVK